MVKGDNYMDQVKIGKFISEKRKEKNITQSMLAEKLNITDRAISKWENGICMPDSGTIPELCKILNITINDLFSGEVVDMKDYDKKMEENLLNMIKEKEETDKRILAMEIVIGVISVIMYFIIVMMASYIEMSDSIRFLTIMSSTVLLIIMSFIFLKIEQTAGYYECRKCHHKYIPTYKSVNLAMHMGRTRYMKCPKCNKKSWQRKVLSK